MTTLEDVFLRLEAEAEVDQAGRIHPPLPSKLSELIIYFMIFYIHLLWLLMYRRLCLTVVLDSCKLISLHALKSSNSTRSIIPIRLFPILFLEICINSAVEILLRCRQY